MRRWRPTHKCIYVIPEIQGNLKSLFVILDRVLPLRIFKNQEDIIVFLGDFIGKDKNSAETVEALINIKEKYNERAIFIKGNNEQNLLNAMFGLDREFEFFIENDGLPIIESYCEFNKLTSHASEIKKNRLKDIIPVKHLEFFQSLKSNVFLDDYVFFHGGFDPNKKIEENSDNTFIYDTLSSRLVKENKISLTHTHVYVGAHNYKNNRPVIHPKYMMLGGSAPKMLVVFELNSMTACATNKGKSRIFPFKYEII